MSSGAEKLKNNRSIAILDAAERGGYGIVSVVCVRPFLPILRKAAASQCNLIGGLRATKSFADLREKEVFH
jgi:hypothetical protein